MTREEAIEWIKTDIIRLPNTPAQNAHKEAVNMAIKALEQEPCEDAISREDVLKLIYDFKEKHTEDREKHPINYGTLLDLIRLIRELPPIKPQEPKTGQWIPVSESESLPEDDTYLVTVERIVGEPRIDTKSFAKDLNKVDAFDFPNHKCGWYDYDSEYGYLEDTDVIAWMSLPAPYKPQEREANNADSD